MANILEEFRDRLKSWFELTSGDNTSKGLALEVLDEFIRTHCQACGGTKSLEYDDEHGDGQPLSVCQNPNCRISRMVPDDAPPAIRAAALAGQLKTELTASLHDLYVMSAPEMPKELRLDWVSIKHTISAQVDWARAWADEAIRQRSEAADVYASPPDDICRGSNR